MGTPAGEPELLGTHQSKHNLSIAGSGLVVSAALAGYLLSKGLPWWLVAAMWLPIVVWATAVMRRKLLVDEDGVTIFNGFKERRFPWTSIRGFWMRQSRGIRGAWLIFWIESDQLWVTVEPGDRLPVRGAAGDYHYINDLLKALNRKLLEAKERR